MKYGAVSATTWLRSLGERDDRINFGRRNGLGNRKQGMALMADSETSELVPLQRQNAEQLKDRMKQERTDKIRKLIL